MKCPRCGNEWDTNRSSCSRCGYVIRMTGKPGGSAIPSPDPFSLGNLTTGGLSAEKQQSGDLPNPWQQSTGLSSAKRQSGGLSGSLQQPDPVTPVNQPFSGFPTLR